MLKSFVELLNARVLSEPQHVAPIDPGQAPGTSNDYEPQRSHAAQQVHIRPFARAPLRLRSGVELEAPEQIVGEHAELLPRAIRAVMVRRHYIERELALQFCERLLLRAAPAHEGEECRQTEGHVGRDGVVLEVPVVGRWLAGTAVGGAWMACKLLALDEAMKSALAPLLALLDVPVEADAQWQILDPAQRRMLTLDAVKRLLLRESRVQPLVLVFEDLHWIDTETQALLDLLVDSLATARVLLLVNYRPEYRSTWGSKTCYSQIRLDALPSESTEELLDDLLGSAPGLETLKPLLVRRGNPFFLEETVRTLVETGVLTGERGRYRLVKPVHAIQAPPTVQTILAARIDRLPAEEKRLLQTASVIGKDVPFGLLQAIAELSEDALRRGLANLKAAEFLYETQLFPDLEYSFKHALTHEVTYAGVLNERRKELHARVAAAMEALYGERLVDHVERAAHHAFRGELWETAVTHCRQAGAKMVARSANREAIAYFEQALAALTHSPPAATSNEQAIDIRFDLRAALTVQGEFKRLLECVAEAERLAIALGDQRRVGWALYYQFNALELIGNSAAAIELGSRAQAIADSVGDSALIIANRYGMGLLYGYMADPRAVSLLQQVIASSAEAQSSERFAQVDVLSVTARACLAKALAYQGRFAEGAAAADEALALGDRLGHPFSSAVAFWTAGALYASKGETGRAIALLERGVALAREWRLPWAETALASNLGWAYARSNQLADGIGRIEQAVERMGAVLFARFWARWFLADAYPLAGRLDDARRAAEGAAADARALCAPGLEAYARCLFVAIEAESERPDVDVADFHFSEAISVATELGLRPLAAHCHARLAKLYGRIGKHPQAHEHFQTATAMYREMGMAYWLEQAEAAFKGLA
jgi:tetratricopeptide (TPR) repeat protein